MQFIKYIILGIIQGITEPLPISSSGHLLIFRELFNTNMFNDLNFEIIANFGSFIAIFIIFRKDIIKLLKSFFKHLLTKDKKTYQNEYKYFINIIIGSIPVGIIGFIFKSKIEAISSVKLVGISLLVTAIALLLVKNVTGHKKDDEITKGNAFVIGLFQMIALIPGLSRSGMVFVGSLLNNLESKTALKYTFMLYFPVSIATFILSIIDITKKGIESTLIAPYLTGLLVALIVTYFTFNWLTKLVKENKLWKFSIYCILLGLFVLSYFK